MNMNLPTLAFDRDGKGLTIVMWGASALLTQREVVDSINGVLSH
jgi:hypothetical protein